MAGTAAGELPPSQPLRSMEDVDAGLAPWLRLNRRLRNEDVQRGLPSVALLYLWEAYNDPFPSNSGGSKAALLTSLTKRLQRAVARDSELCEDMRPEGVSAPLQHGLRDSHCLRWPLQLVPPGDGEVDPQFEAFSSRWKKFLATLTLSAAADPTLSKRPRTPTQMVPV